MENHDNEIKAAQVLAETIVKISKDKELMKKLISDVGDPSPELSDDYRLLRNFLVSDLSLGFEERFDAVLALLPKEKGNFRQATFHHFFEQLLTTNEAKKFLEYKKAENKIPPQVIADLISKADSLAAGLKIALEQIAKTNYTGDPESN